MPFSRQIWVYIKHLWWLYLYKTDAYVPMKGNLILHLTTTIFSGRICFLLYTIIVLIINRKNITIQHYFTIYFYLINQLSKGNSSNLYLLRWMQIEFSKFDFNNNIMFRATWQKYFILYRTYPPTHFIRSIHTQ